MTSATEVTGSVAPSAVIGNAIGSANLALAGLSLSMLMASLDTSIANAGLPVLASVFSASFQQVQWVVLSYLLAVTTLIVSAGRLGDVMGRRKLLLLGIVVFTVASTACGAAPSLGILIAARAAQGLGAAIMMSLTLAFVAETVPKERTGRAVGLLGVMSAVGTALGPPLGGFLISGSGWRAMFLVNVPLGIVAFILAYCFLPANRKSGEVTAVAFDAWGTILLALAIGAYSLAMTVGRGRFGAINIALIFAALVGIALFMSVESRVKDPLVRLSMFRNYRFSSSLIASSLVSTVMMSTLVVGPFYLSRALGLSPMHLGLALSVGPAVVALVGVPAGRLADRMGAIKIAIYGLCTMVTGSLFLATTSREYGILGYIAPIIFLTAGYSLFQTANNTSIISGISPDMRGVVSGMLNLSRNLGLITGASAMGAIFAFASGTADVATAQPHSVDLGLRITFTVTTILLMGALALISWNRIASTQESALTRNNPIFESR